MFFDCSLSTRDDTFFVIFLRLYVEAKIEDFTPSQLLPPYSFDVVCFIYVFKAYAAASLLRVASSMLKDSEKLSESEASLLISMLLLNSLQSILDFNFRFFLILVADLSVRQATSPVPRTVKLKLFLPDFDILSFRF